MPQQTLLAAFSKGGASKSVSELRHAVQLPVGDEAAINFKAFKRDTESYAQKLTQHDAAVQRGAKRTRRDAAGAHEDDEEDKAGDYAYAVRPEVAAQHEGTAALYLDVLQAKVESGKMLSKQQVDSLVDVLLISVGCRLDAAAERALRVLQLWQQATPLTKFVDESEAGLPVIMTYNGYWDPLLREAYKVQGGLPSDQGAGIFGTAPPESMQMFHVLLKGLRVMDEHMGEALPWAALIRFFVGLLLQDLQQRLLWLDASQGHDSIKNHTRVSMLEGSYLYRMLHNTYGTKPTGKTIDSVECLVRLLAGLVAGTGDPNPLTRSSLDPWASVALLEQQREARREAGADGLQRLAAMARGLLDGILRLHGALEALNHYNTKRANERSDLDGFLMDAMYSIDRLLHTPEQCRALLQALAPRDRSRLITLLVATRYSVERSVSGQFRALQDAKAKFKDENGQGQAGYLEIDAGQVMRYLVEHPNQAEKSFKSSEKPREHVCMLAVQLMQALAEDGEVRVGPEGAACRGVVEEWAPKLAPKMREGVSKGTEADPGPMLTSLAAMELCLPLQAEPMAA